MAHADHAFVVMAYGDSPFLPHCLASIAVQSRRSQAVITTSTPSDYVREAGKRAGVAVIVNPERAGIAADWNFALKAAAARHVTLAHQDDVYLPAFLARSLDLLEASENAVLAFTGYDEIDDHGARRRSPISFAKHALEGAILGSAQAPAPKRLKSFLSLGNPLPCSSVTFDRERLGDFAFSDAFRSNLDWDAWLRLLDGGARFVRTRERLIGRRHNRLTATATLTREGVRRAEDEAIFRRLWPRPLADLIAFAYRAGYQ
ncbi:MAG TPA: glycosyltransferase family 2 protein [Caulobacteraceae bacterium]|nr:glycosyltransferase family 2 protein [Caulobacteraceae bacterium]